MSEEAPGHRNFHCALTRRDMSILPVLLNTTALLATIDINILTYIFVFFCGTPSPAQAARKISGSGFEFLSWEASAQKVKNSRSSSAAKIVGAFRETEASPTGICCARRSASKERMPGRTALTVNSRSEWT